MTSGKSHAVAFDSVVDAIGDLVERLVDASVRLSQLEAMNADGADIVQRLDAFDARLTKLETRQRRPPPFPVSLITTENPGHKAELDLLSRDLATERHERTRADERLHNAQQGANGTMAAVHGAVAKVNLRLNEDSATFDRMRSAFKLMTARIEVLEARTAGTGDPPNGGPT
jgi:hypothetical protein